MKTAALCFMVALAAFCLGYVMRAEADVGTVLFIALVFSVLGCVAGLFTQEDKG
jgi:hypothetical protein